MGNNKWMYYVAYAVLVVGGGIALMMSERPLSATVVTLALFSFNMAAIVLVMPAILNFLSRMKERTDHTEEDVMLQLKEIKARVLILANAANKGVPLKNTLEKTAETHAPRDVSQVSQGQTNTQTTSSGYSQAALNSVQNAAVLPSTGSMGGIPTPAKPLSSGLNNGLSSLDNIFNPTRTAVIQKPAVPAQKPNMPEQPSLFANANEQAQSVDEGVSEAQPQQANVEETQTPTPAAPATAKADVLLIVKAHVEEDDVLCLRGEGPGLNWQEGMPMNYTGNDEWSWSAKDISQAITCRIYLNDEISAFGDDIVLNPGDATEVSPSFPQIEA